MDMLEKLTSGHRIDWYSQQLRRTTYQSPTF